MISPDLLRGYPFFGAFDDDGLATVALATEVIECLPGEVLFESDQPAWALYVLIAGALELWIVAAERQGTGVRSLYPAGEISTGEVAGISALVPPHVYTATGQITRPSRLLQINAQALRDLSAVAPRLDAALMHVVAQATMNRLQKARAQLLATRKPTGPLGVRAM